MLSSGCARRARGGSNGVKSFLVSWLAKRYAGADLRTFLKERTEDWIVWEAGPWRPPAAGRETMAASPGTRLLSAGESLAIALVPGAAGDVRVGRAPENEVVIDDATLSRSHLVLHRDPAGVWTARDAGSSNGTRVDGVRIARVPFSITPGARLDAGTVRLTFYDGASLFMRLRGAG
jgi:hypothetical protein